MKEEKTLAVSQIVSAIISKNDPASDEGTYSLGCHMYFQEDGTILLEEVKGYTNIEKGVVSHSAPNGITLKQLINNVSLWLDEAE